jgi:hypothetical protein
MQKNSPNLLTLFSVAMLSGFVLANAVYAGEHDANHTRPKSTKPGGAKPVGDTPAASSSLVNNENVPEVRGNTAQDTASNSRRKNPSTDPSTGPIVTDPIDPVATKPPTKSVLVNNENIEEVRGGTPQSSESADKERKKNKGDWHATEVPGGYMATTGKTGDPIGLNNTDGKIYTTESEAQHASNKYNRFERKGEKFMDTGEVTPGGPLK